jgi:hypothetical protein
MRSPRDGADQDLEGTLAPQRQPATADLEKTGTSRAEHLQTASGTNAKLRHAADPRLLAANVGNVGPFTSLEEFEREEAFTSHGGCSRRSGGKIRLVETESQSNLNGFLGLVKAPS